MLRNPSHLERFIRWFVTPLQVLKMIPNGDGGFIALSIGCSLCERYYRTISNTQDEWWNGDPFIVAASTDLRIEKDFFCHFWDIYRNGMQHQGAPKTVIKKNEQTKTETIYSWRTSHVYSAIPTQLIENNTIIICINPWDFSDLMVQKFLTNPDVLTKAMNHAFGDIFQINTSCKPEEVPPKDRK